MDNHANPTDQPVQNSSQVPEDHADVVTAERVALGSFQGASPQSTVVFHVPDHRLDCTAPSQEFGNRPGDTTLRAADENLHSNCSPHMQVPKTPQQFQSQPL